MKPSTLLAVRTGPLIGRLSLPACIALVILAADARAAESDPGRLFYTPAQRAQLEHARTNKLAPRARASDAPDRAPAPLRYDGLIIRSDGRTTHWIDGAAQSNASGVAGLKPGQVRAGDKVYEPYQILRPKPAAPATTPPSVPAVPAQGPQKDAP